MVVTSIRYSVVIPAYNAERTINRCISSILYSDRKDVEVLVINDGSTDNTGDICRNFSKRDGRLKYYEKTNGGASSARNKGIELASGDFISFVDSDDFVSSDYFEKFDKELREDCDILFFGRKVFDGIDYKYNKIKECCFNNIQETVTVLSESLRKQMLNSLCDKVFKLNLIKTNNILFPEHLHIGEDAVFVVRYIMNIQSIKYINSPLYIISTENKKSLSRKAREDLCDSMLLEHSMLFDAIDKSKLSEKYKHKYFSAVYFSYYRSAYTSALEINKFKISAKEKKSRIKEICKKYHQNSIKKYCDFKTKIISIPIKLSLVHIISFILKAKEIIK